jgi:hypothetical protein
MRVLLFVHFVGQCLWIGGAVAAMVMALAARREPVEVRAGAFRLVAQVHAMVIGPGALLVVASGVLLTMQFMGGDAMELMAAPRIWVMQGAGLLGGLMVLFVGLPTAVKMGGLAVPDQTGALSPQFEGLRKRQAIVSSIAAGLAFVALFVAVLL